MKKNYIKSHRPWMIASLLSKGDIIHLVDTVTAPHWCVDGIYELNCDKIKIHRMFDGIIMLINLDRKVYL